MSAIPASTHRSPYWLLTTGYWLLLLFLTGCDSANQRTVDRALGDYFAGSYYRSAQQLRPLAEKTDENFVLNNCRLGSAALADYDFAQAEAAFLRAYEVVNSFGVNNGGRTLGAVLVDEKMKIWKGEPFERAMLNFYLGLVYYIQRDYNNARAAFENALFKLHDYGDDKANPDQLRTIESNFALGQVMLGRCWQRLGREDLARAVFDEVARNQPRLAALADYQRNADSNVLLVVDYGFGPLKTTDFDGAIVGFSPTPHQQGPIPPPVVVVDGSVHRMDDVGQPPVDLLALAQDRRWQSMDTWRTVKSAVGTGLIVGGAVEGVRGITGSGSRARTDLIVAGALIGTGLLLKATSQADTRV